MNQEQIKKRIRELEREARDVPKDEEYKRLGDESKRAETAWRGHYEWLYNKHKPTADKCWEQIFKLRDQLRQLQNQHNVPISDKLKAWLKEHTTGIEHGDTWRIWWVSADEEYVVVKRPGRAFWSGIGFRSYGTTRFELRRTDEKGRWSGGAIWEHEGRWSARCVHEAACAAEKHRKAPQKGGKKS